MNTSSISVRLLVQGAKNISLDNIRLPSPTNAINNEYNECPTVTEFEDLTINEDDNTDLDIRTDMTMPYVNDEAIENKAKLYYDIKNGSFKAQSMASKGNDPMWQQVTFIPVENCIQDNSINIKLYTKRFFRKKIVERFIISNLQQLPRGVLITNSIKGMIDSESTLNILIIIEEWDKLLFRKTNPFKDDYNMWSKSTSIMIDVSGCYKIKFNNDKYTHFGEWESLKIVNVRDQHQMLFTINVVYNEGPDTVYHVKIGQRSIAICYEKQLQYLSFTYHRLDYPDLFEAVCAESSQSSLPIFRLLHNRNKRIGRAHKRVRKTKEKNEIEIQLNEEINQYMSSANLGTSMHLMALVIICDMKQQLESRVRMRAVHNDGGTGVRIVTGILDNLLL
ncbi:hypothetical protein AKO1_008828 [Acrasis kona]|uniref:Uncharacterized protein n=1 Tax=Acrasis kona TaxID=1008807 RepID=A0AAW2ZIY5_9EUKA